MFYLTIVCFFFHIQREQKWLDEQQQILESLNVLQNELKQQVVTFSESRY